MCRNSATQEMIQMPNDLQHDLGVPERRCSNGGCGKEMFLLSTETDLTGRLLSSWSCPRCGSIEKVPTARIRSLSDQDVIDRCCEHFSITKREIIHKKRSQRIALIRQAVYYVMRHRLGMSWSEIGRVLDRDHTSVMHGARWIQELLEFLSLGGDNGHHPAITHTARVGGAPDPGRVAGDETGGGDCEA